MHINRIIQGNCRELLCELPEESVDLIYMDPPFKSGKDWGEFDDRYTDSEYVELMHWVIKNAYRTLKKNGTMLIHCDTSATHLLRHQGDSVFGGCNYRNEIIWQYDKLHGVKKHFARCHDTIHRWTKSSSWKFKQVTYAIDPKESVTRERYVNYLDNGRVYYRDLKHCDWKHAFTRIKSLERKLNRKLIDSDVVFDFTDCVRVFTDVVSIPLLKGNSKEKNGYPTQKPQRLLELLIESCSHKGDLVLDPFCGSGTTLAAARHMERNYIGMDIGDMAMLISRERMGQLTMEDVI